MMECKNKGTFKEPNYVCVDPRKETMVGGSCIALGASGCEGNNGKCCREGNPYTGTMMECKNKGTFEEPNYVCVDPRKETMVGGCIALGASGCEGNNGKCCREGNPYTGTMMTCKNKGTFEEPNYVCVDPRKEVTVGVASTGEFTRYGAGALFIAVSGAVGYYVGSKVHGTKFSYQELLDDQ